MKSIVTIFLAVLFGGCYTQVKTSGDYWGYTGAHHERARAYATPDTTPQQAYEDTSSYPDSTSAQMGDRPRDDEGYSGDRGLIYDDPYYYNYYDYYSAPYVSFNLGWGGGWHRPYWGLGFSSYYPYGYGAYYDPWWNWYYAPGFSPYGCLGYGGYYGYGLYGGYRGFYGGHRGLYGDGFRSGFGRRGFDLGAGRTGRISGGESRGRGSSVNTSAGNSASVRNAGRTGMAPSYQNFRSSQTRRSQTMMTSPRNNPRLAPQSGRVVYARSNQSRQGYASPRSYGGSTNRSAGGGYQRSGNGGGYRASGGGSHGGGGGGSRSGGSGGGGHRGR